MGQKPGMDLSRKFNAIFNFRFFEDYTAVPNLSALGTGFVKDNFSMNHLWGDGFRMIQVCFIYCPPYLYNYDISSTSDHQALDPRG